MCDESSNTVSTVTSLHQSAATATIAVMFTKNCEEFIVLLQSRGSKHVHMCLRSLHTHTYLVTIEFHCADFFHHTMMSERINYTNNNTQRLTTKMSCTSWLRGSASSAQTHHFIIMMIIINIIWLQQFRGVVCVCVCVAYWTLRWLPLNTTICRVVSDRSTGRLKLQQRYKHIRYVYIVML